MFNNLLLKEYYPWKIGKDFGGAKAPAKDLDKAGIYVDYDAIEDITNTLQAAMDCPSAEKIDNFLRKIYNYSQETQGRMHGLARNLLKEIYLNVSPGEGEELMHFVFHDYLPERLTWAAICKALLRA